METKVNGRKQRSVAEWREILSRYAASGGSQAEFCRAEGLSRSTLDIWRRKLGSKASAKKAAREFVELSPVAEPGIGGWIVELELPDGRLARLRC